MTGNQTVGSKLIGTFLGLVDLTCEDGIPDFHTIQSLPFVHLWPNMIIYRHEPVVHDFRVVLFGTEIVHSYGEDWTGQLISQSGFEKEFDVIYGVNMDIIEKRIRIHDRGTIDNPERGYKRWYEVKMPLRRNGEIAEVLVFMCFD